MSVQEKKMNKKLYKPFRSSAKGKKYSVYVKRNGKKVLIHFGDKNYRHNYSESARKSYMTRSAGIRDKYGRLTKDNKNSANYWARKILWSGKKWRKK